MIDPQEQWCIQIDITNSCSRQCSNCTRLIGHHHQNFFMTPGCFAEAVYALRNFPTQSPPTKQKVANKLVGIIGGEPLLHPSFSLLVQAMTEAIPKRKHRGLWTGLNWQNTRYASLIKKSFGFINNNKHQGEVLHSPILVSSKDFCEDESHWRQLISHCWMQEKWSSTITPKGFFFCEVAGALDMLFDGPGGLPVTEDCWKIPLTEFIDQVNRWCSICGLPLNLRGRKDSEEIDDISSSNLTLLSESPRVKSGQYNLVESLPPQTPEPWKYR